MTPAVTAPTVTLFGLDAALVTVPSAAGSAAATAALLRAGLGSRAHAVVPGADTVLVKASAGLAGAPLLSAVTEVLATAADSPAMASTSKTVTLPVRYDGADLADVARLLGFSVEEVVARHTAATYTVAFLGFAPGFPYLTGLDPALASVARLDSPRTRIPAGSVGLAAGQTCVYPAASPGGWRLLGHTDTVLFDAAEASPALLGPGDTVRFEAVA